MQIVQYNLLVNKKKKVSYVKESNTFEYSASSDRMCSPETVYEMVEEIFNLSSQAEEMIYMVALNAKSAIIGVFNVGHGTVNKALMSPREIYLRALLVGAAFVIVMHNHPSQDTTPSREDIQVTKRLKEVGELLGIPLTDHLIIGDGYYSFRESNLI